MLYVLAFSVVVCLAEMSKSIVKVSIGIGFLTFISIAKTISQVLVLVKNSSSIDHNTPHKAL